MSTDQPQTIYLKDYQPPAWKVDSLGLTFRIDQDNTVVTSEAVYQKNTGGALVLNGEHQKLLSVELDGRELVKGQDFTLEGDHLTITNPPADQFTLKIKTSFDPGQNTRLEGLYKSGGNWCTQCEAEGFRGITYFQDRPDVMTVFRTRIEAPKEICPVLLSNGNLVDEGVMDDGYHYTVWHDPFPKPCYLFALVAGDLEYIQDEFTTMNGRKVDLRIYVRDGDQEQSWHAMDSLKRSMKWDEDVYGREYQLERFNIVAVSDFNMGAMENTSLNIFNTALVLADRDTATDRDFERVDAVVAHEYFHNWTGNRVTCRDWFQLSLKEGLTVFRDQAYTADQTSEDVKRIDDVSMLRQYQFPEDSSPLAHPIRPDNYIEIDNFYTVTVYEKGAEVIRMLHQLLGAETYRKATDLYFDRFDGQAVTCDDFVKCMEDASGRDLSQFKLWYSQAGTPRVYASGVYDETAKTYTVTLKQDVPDTAGQTNKKPMHIPVKVGLVGPNGEDMVEEVLDLTEKEQSFTFENIDAKPVPSILRGFSAPVVLETDLTTDDLRFLMVNDSDGFNRWEAGQEFAMRQIGAILIDGEAPWGEFLSAFGEILEQAAKEDADKALMARALTLPSITDIGQRFRPVDPAKIKAARDKLKDAIRDRYAANMEQIYNGNRSGAWSPDFASVSRRLLKNTLLNLFNNHATAYAQYEQADNMTDRMAALSVLADGDTQEREKALADFYERFQDYPLVIDKWFRLQACAERPEVLDDIKKLKSHPAFNMKNPNRARSLVGAFAVGNPVYFHDKSGKGYDFVTDVVLELNKINPQIAARLLTPFKDWSNYTEDRQDKIKAALKRILDEPDLSPNVYEIASKSLNA